MDVELAEDAPEGWTVIAASGIVDVTSADNLPRQLDELLEPAATKVIIDLDEVDFIDSVGVQLLLDTAERLRDVDGDLRLVCRNSRLLRVFAIAGLTDTVVVAESAEEAADPESVEA